MKWYAFEEIDRWAEASKHLSPTDDAKQWLTDQLNTAFQKGQQIAVMQLKEALRMVGRDMHETSTRPCATCQFCANALGEKFGCTARQKT